MSNNMMLGECKNCGQTYCQECSDNIDWLNFCSTKCELEYRDSQEFKDDLAKEE